MVLESTIMDLCSQLEPTAQVRIAHALLSTQTSQLKNESSTPQNDLAHLALDENIDLLIQWILKQDAAKRNPNRGYNRVNQCPSLNLGTGFSKN